MNGLRKGEGVFYLRYHFLPMQWEISSIFAHAITYPLGDYSIIGKSSTNLLEISVD